MRKNAFIINIIFLVTLCFACGSNQVKKVPTSRLDLLIEQKFCFLDTLYNLDQYSLETVNNVYPRSFQVISFMENLTGIEGSYPADALGRRGINEIDFMRWSVWYFKNKSHLCINDQGQIAICE